MRLIDKDKIYSDLYDADAITFAGLRMLANADEVDAVPVVRCKKCRFRFSCMLVAGVTEFGFFDPDDFCSQGEADTDG